MADSVLILIQIIFIVMIACMAFGSGCLPNVIPWCKKSTNILGIANAFSGGVFLAIAFMHILPEVSRDYNTHMTKDKKEMLGDGDEEKEYFPLPFALAFAGYAFILLIDKVIFDTHSLVGEDHHGHTVDPAQAEFVGNVKNSFIQFQKMLSSDMDNHQCINDSEIINMGIKNYLSRNDKFAVRMSHALRPLSKKDLSRTFVKKTRGLDDEQADLFADKDNIDLRETAQDALISHEETQKKKRCACNLTPVVLMIALSTHAVFEGIAVGLVKDLDDLWTYVIAISLHKWAAAMSLGISMSKNFKDETTTMYLLLLIFAFATPLGISIGMGVSGSSDLTDIIFSSLAGGTFVYIACSEVIVEEFSTPEFKWLKMCAFLLGAGLITSLNFIES